MPETNTEEYICGWSCSLQTGYPAFAAWSSRPPGKPDLKASVVPDTTGHHKATFFDQLDVEAADDLTVLALW